MLLRDATTKNVMVAGTWIKQRDLRIIADILSCAITVHKLEGMWVYRPCFLFVPGGCLFHMRIDRDRA
jgi:hypothetical protein